MTSDQQRSTYRHYSYEIPLLSVVVSTEEVRTKSQRRSSKTLFSFRGGSERSLVREKKRGEHHAHAQAHQRSATDPTSAGHASQASDVPSRPAPKPNVNRVESGYREQSSACMTHQVRAIHHVCSSFFRSSGYEMEVRVRT